MSRVLAGQCSHNLAMRACPELLVPRFQKRGVFLLWELLAGCSYWSPMSLLYVESVQEKGGAHEVCSQLSLGHDKDPRGVGT